MDLFERLPQDDVHKLWRYISNYGSGDGCLTESEMNYFLRYWNTAKAPFFKAFGEKFIVKKPVCFNKPVEELEEDMENALRYEHTESSLFRNEFLQAIKEVYPAPYNDDLYNLWRFVDDWHMLATNIYDGPPITIPGIFTRDGRPLQVNQNCKVSKMLGKIAAALGCEQHYEEFRQIHSQVLNQKQIRGNLCLSIHPLDFITMSDNASNWSSCMCWMDEGGDYRMGTIEMMNSPYVIIAYIEAKDPMELEFYYHPADQENPINNQWNNKRWRQLYIVTPEMILGNRQYPYENDVVQGTAIKWIRELMSTDTFYGPYSEEACQIVNHSKNDFGPYRKYISLNFNYMYNDIYGKKLAYIAPKYFIDGNDFRLNLSGPAVCTKCGDVVEPGTIEANETICRGCSGYFYCAHCGEWCGGESYSVGGNGLLYCEHCYYTELEQCECCGDRYEESELTHVYIQMPDIEEFDDWRYYVCVCSHCLRTGQYVRMWGDLGNREDDFGHMRTYIDLRNISDDALYDGDFDYRTAEKLVEIRDAESLDKMIELIKEL